MRREICVPGALEWNPNVTGSMGCVSPNSKMRTTLTESSAQVQGSDVSLLLVEPQQLTQEENGLLSPALVTHALNPSTQEAKVCTSL